jgi:hypothetical protein
MLTPLRKPIHAIRIVEKFLKDSAQLRQSASVKDLDKKTIRPR